MVSDFVVFRWFWCYLLVGRLVVVAVLLFPSCCCYGALLLDCFKVVLFLYWLLALIVFACVDLIC